jgi:competence ComEA-like helix-hairpin-helix protein
LKIHLFYQLRGAIKNLFNNLNLSVCIPTQKCKIDRLKGENTMKKYITTLIMAAVLFVFSGISHATTLNMIDLTGQININSATKDELVMLPYISDKVAQNIIVNRNVNGPYKSVNDLLKVKGVDKKLLYEVGAYLKTDGATTLREDRD